MENYKIRTAVQEDLPALSELFRETVQRVNAADYTQPQIAAWLAKATPARWQELFASKLHFLVAERDGMMLGFASVDASGYLHSLFIHAGHQRRGIASALLDAATAYAQEHGAARLHTEASITALPFFEKSGFTRLGEQQVHIGGQTLTNYLLERPLGSKLRKAVQGDLPRILEIIRQAQAQMRARGSMQWQNGYPAAENIDADIRRGYGCVLCADNRVIAYAAVVFDGEPAYDGIEGQWLTQGDYVVVHRLAVADEVKGRGVATQFMQQIGEIAQRQGVPSFRVDTNFDNTPMLRMLDTLGFVRCGEIRYEGAPRIAFEKILRG